MKKYSQALDILKRIRQANNIIINIHRNPDLDSVGSASAMYELLQKMGKQVTLICPHVLDKKFFFLKHVNLVKTIDYETFDFSSFDLFLILDTASWFVASDKKNISWVMSLNLDKIVIDHHKTNSISNTEIYLVDEQSNSTGQIVYYLLKSWNMEITKNVATALYSTIIGDTYFLRHTKDIADLYKIMSALVESGADNEKLLKNFYYSFPINYFQLIGEFLKNMTLIRSKAIVYTAINYATYLSYNKPAGIRENVADAYFMSVLKAKFGVVMVEEEIGKLMISFRSISVDVSKIAKVFGGGGREHAAGATVYGNFTNSVNKVLNLISNFQFS